MNTRFISTVSGLVAMFALLAFSVLPTATHAAGVSTIDQRCVAGDGVIEFSFTDVTRFELHGPDSQNSNTNADVQSFSDLSDGNYTLKVFDSEGNKDSVNFTVDCDENEPETCDPNPEADLSATSFHPKQGSVTIKNDSDNCTYKVGIASYKGFDRASDPDYLVVGTQELFDHKTTNVQPNSEVTLDIDVPNCAFQIDAFYGDVVMDLSTGESYGERKIVWSHENVENLCGDDPEEPDFNLKAKQCVEENGVAEIQVVNELDSYKLVNTSTGNTIVNDTDGADSGTITFSDLPDGNYRFEGTLNGETKSISFTIDCDEDNEPDPDFNLIAQRCVAEDGVVEIEITNELDSYKLVNTSTGNTVVNDTDGAGSGAVSFSDLPDGNYRFEGTLNGKTDSLTFTINCDENNGSELTGTCSVSDSTVGLGDDVTFTSSAAGGQSPYSYSWNLEGSDDDANTQNITTEYQQTGTYNGTVTITDDAGDQVTRTCSVRVETSDDDDDGDGGGGDRLDPRDDDDDRVRGDRDENFSIQCLPEKSAYKTGEVVLFETTIDNEDIDIDDVDFDWSGTNNINETNDTATARFNTDGIKEIRVSAEYDGETETDTCYVQIGREGVTLDQVPYTGPSDLAKTLAFLTTILLLALGGSAAIMKRREDDGVPVGIPSDHN